MLDLVPELEFLRIVANVTQSVCHQHQIDLVAQ